MKKRSYSTVLLLVLTVTPAIASMTLTACGGRTMTRTTRTTPDDATITTRVKTALLNDPDIKGKIDVDTANGVVTLSGAVKTAVERDKAVAIARKISGVSDVKSNVQIE
jgi:hyperosmotically inducible protein